MHKLEVTLKQHTPLIHFQHDQEGATLRASEVKPKLDRFILEKLKEEGKPFSHLFSGSNKHEALDYKLRVISDNVRTSRITDRFPLFFANMGDGYRKEFRFCNGSTHLKISSFDEEIIYLIKAYIVEFLLKNNFGTRQSKGFGSFYLDQNDSLYQSPLQTQLLDYRFKATLRGNDEASKWFSLFESIELFYKVLRSGINICNREGKSIFYMKSIMFKYAKEKGLQWDKKTIKENYYPRAVEEQKQNHHDKESADILHFFQSKGDKYLFKDLLGLSSSENWRLPYRQTITKEHLKNNNESEIERFKSPVIFKPIRINEDSFNVFFHGYTVPNDFLGKQFKIKHNNQGNLTLKTYPKFDIDDFLDYAIFEVDLEELLGDEEYVNHPKFQAIETMFNQIRKDYE